MRLNRSTWFCSAMILGMFAFLTGCDSAAPPSAPANKAEEQKHKHDENKEVGHKHGPNDGHIVELEGGGDQYHLEWTHDDATGTVSMYILDKDEKNIADADAAEITVESKAGDKVTEYKLPKVASESATVKASKFEVAEKPLLNALMAPEGVTNTVKVTIGGKPYTTVIKYDPANAH